MKKFAGYLESFISLKIIMKYALIIPARLASKRLPAKPLLKIGSKTVLQMTYERALKAVPQKHIFIATDSLKIKKHAEEFYAKVIMTSKKCLTGTDRIAEANLKINADIVINLQGDEPIMPPENIRLILKNALKYPKSVINGYAQIYSTEEFESIHIPKCVISESQNLLYMSRFPIPGSKINKVKKSYKQICVYSFPKKELQWFKNNKKKSINERIEDIEILRFLDHGINVKMVKLKSGSIAVDTPEDLIKVKTKLNIS